MSHFELSLALSMGFQPSQILINGPYKPAPMLEYSLVRGAGPIIVDSMDELAMLDKLAERLYRKGRILIRVNPDYIPKGMNHGTATGSRKGSAFGFDLKGGEVHEAIDRLGNFPNLKFSGFHFHIGSGMRSPKDYYHALLKLKPIVGHTLRLGHEIGIMDIGGGIGAPWSREMNNMELLSYMGFDYLPEVPVKKQREPYSAFANWVCRGMGEVFGKDKLPVLVSEPGRAIASPNQILLLSVHQVKQRGRNMRWITTDGGIGTFTMPTLYEFHEIFLCNDVSRPGAKLVTINGPGCFSADQVYRSVRMPEVKPGEILAIMDSGAYFTSWESNFGHPRPAVVSVMNGEAEILRRRENFIEMAQRDLIDLDRAILDQSKFEHTTIESPKNTST